MTPRDVPPLLGNDFPLPLDQPFTTSQAGQAGLTPKHLTRLVEQGLLIRMTRGVYVAAQAEDSTMLRAQALALVVPPGVVIGDATAAWLLGLDTQAPGDHRQVPAVSLLTPPCHRASRNPLARSCERTLLPEDVTVVEGLAVTTPLRTALDQGRLLHRDRAMGALDAWLRAELFTKEALLANVERFAGERGVRQLRELVPLADPRAESFGESALRLRWLDQGTLPHPTPQIPVCDDHGRQVYRLDLGVEALRYAVEYDGEEHHSTPEQRARDHQRRTWIQREHGWIIDPVGRNNVFGPLRDIERILHEGVRAARRRIGRWSC